MLLYQCPCSPFPKFSESGDGVADQLGHMARAGQWDEMPGRISDEMLDAVPVQWRVVRTIRPKYSCRACEKIVQAPAPVKAIARGKATFGTLASAVANGPWPTMRRHPTRHTPTRPRPATSRSHSNSRCPTRSKHWSAP